MISKLEKKVLINIDGGSRNNPGPAALGVVFLNEKGRVIKDYFQFLGKATNNEAEYQAFIFALRKAKLLFGRERIKNLDIELRSDSSLLVNQLKGEYKVKEENIKKLFLEAWNLKIDFKNLKIILIPREENKAADRLVNQALDSQPQKLI